MTWHLFLDESGDLGFDFDNKDSSKFLTISVLAVSQIAQAKKIRNAVKLTLRRKVNGRRKLRKSPKEELKGAETDISVKRYFYSHVKEIDFSVYAMSLDKRKVQEALRFTPSAKDNLYNFVARRVVDRIPFEKATGEVELIVDKSKGKKGVADFDKFLSHQIKGKLDPRTRFSIHHRSSKEDFGLSAADLFCWGIFRYRERDDNEWRQEYENKIRVDELYSPDELA